MVNVTADHATQPPGALTVSSLAFFGATVLQLLAVSNSQSSRQASVVHFVPSQFDGPSGLTQRIGGLLIHVEALDESEQVFTAENTTWQ